MGFGRRLPHHRIIGNLGFSRFPGRRLTPERSSGIPEQVFLGLILGAGLYLVLIFEALVLLVFGGPVRPGPPLSPARVVLALAVLLPVYALAGAGGGLLLGTLRTARRSRLGWMLSGIAVTFVASATSTVAGRITLALAGLNLVDSDSPRAAWPLDGRHLAVIVIGGATLGLLASRWLAVRPSGKKSGPTA